MFGSTEASGIALDGVSKLHWHQNSNTLPKLWPRGSHAMNQRMNIYVTVVCLRLQVNNNKNCLRWISCGWTVKALSCRNTLIIESLSLISSVSWLATLCCYSAIMHSKKVLYDCGLNEMKLCIIGGLFSLDFFLLSKCPAVFHLSQPDTP